MNKEVIHGISTGFLDFPGRYAVTLFFAGCNIRCPFCHNLDVVDSIGFMSLDDAKRIVDGLKTKFLGGLGVVFSGGEPTADMATLERAFYLFGDMPLGIHTNGVNIPFWKNSFESVTLSLKAPAVIGVSDIEYLTIIAKAMKYYESSPLKELRYVDGTVPMHILNEVLGYLTDDWFVVCEDDSNMRGGVSFGEIG